MGSFLGPGCRGGCTCRGPLRQGSSDDFQTPPCALSPLAPHLRTEWIIWECASGKGNLSRELRRRGHRVLATDIATGRDFLSRQPKVFDCIITHPPFRHKQQFLERCYELGRPFALLLPLTTFETRRRQELFQTFGIEVILLDRRINFETPVHTPESSAWFATAWFTFGLNIGRTLSFSQLIT
jgi:hypothetical protein